MDRLLNFDEAFDINLLEQLVAAVFGENDNEVWPDLTSKY